jgi:hypothetical protein
MLLAALETIEADLWLHADCGGSQDGECGVARVDRLLSWCGR